MNRNFKILVATHKKYSFPIYKCYIPIHVGKNEKENLEYIGDNTGNNISSKNPFYCELTALYWGWKNLDAEYIGLVHYRRYFTNKNMFSIKRSNIFKYVLYENTINEMLKNNDIILPKKRKYYIENLYSHYKNTTYIETLDETEKIIKEKYPEYLEEFEKLHTRTSAHMFNMFIMKKEILNSYCTWLFDILFELEKRIDITQYDTFHSRFFGRVSELLLDVWINKNNLNYKEVKVIDIEKVNWLKKGSAFILAKFTNKRYSKSF